MGLIVYTLLTILEGLKKYGQSWKSLFVCVSWGCGEFIDVSGRKRSNRRKNYIQKDIFNINERKGLTFGAKPKKSDVQF